MYGMFETFNKLVNSQRLKKTVGVDYTYLSPTINSLTVLLLQCKTVVNIIFSNHGAVSEIQNIPCMVSLDAQFL